MNHKSKKQFIIHFLFVYLICSVTLSTNLFDCYRGCEVVITESVNHIFLLGLQLFKNVRSRYINNHKLV